VTHQLNGPDEQAKKIGLNPLSSGAKTEDEGLYPVQHSYWAETMRAAVAAEEREAAERAANPAAAQAGTSTGCGH
jgi:benzoate/toluate 1,2-dioxygenase alpha subunit